MVVKIEKQITYSSEDLIDILSCAEIGYWGKFNCGTEEYKNSKIIIEERTKNNPNSMDNTIEGIWAYMLEHNMQLEIDDEEDDEVYYLTLVKLQHGIEMAVKNNYWTGDLDDLDGEIGDIIIQYALFDDIVYG